MRSWKDLSVSLQVYNNLQYIFFLLKTSLQKISNTIIMKYENLIHVIMIHREICFTKKCYSYTLCGWCVRSLESIEYVNSKSFYVNFVLDIHYIWLLNKCILNKWSYMIISYLMNNGTLNGNYHGTCYGPITVDHFVNLWKGLGKSFDSFTLIKYIKSFS